MTREDLLEAAARLETEARGLRDLAAELPRRQLKLVPEGGRPSAPPAKDKGPTTFDLTLAQFCALWAETHAGMVYRPSGADKAQLGRLLNIRTGLPPAEVLQLGRYFRAYLADADPFIARQGHTLTLFCSRVNAYRAAVAKANGHDVELQPA